MELGWLVFDIQIPHSIAYHIYIYTITVNDLDMYVFYVG